MTYRSHRCETREKANLCFETKEENYGKFTDSPAIDTLGSKLKNIRSIMTIFSSQHYDTGSRRVVIEFLKELIFPLNVFTWRPIRSSVIWENMAAITPVIRHTY